MRILVADDDPSVRDLLAMQLSLEGYAVTTVDDGQQALDAVATDPPDLLLLDVMMPRVSGWEVLEQVRATSRLPVLLLTARDVPDDRHRARELGASAVMAKPHDGDALLVTVAALLTARPARA